MKLVKLISRLFDWWTLQNWESAATLASRLTVVWVAISASSLFIVVPRVDKDVRVSWWDINPEIIRRIYSEDAREFPGDIWGFARAAQKLEDLSYQAAVQGHVSIYANWSDDEYWTNLVVYFWPETDDNPFEDWSNDEIKFLMGAASDAFYAQFSLTVTNTGQSFAYHVSITAPDFYLAKNPPQEFTLGPGESRSFEFLHYPGAIQPTYLSPENWSSYALQDFEVNWDRSGPFPPAKFIPYLGVLMILLWATVVVRDIWETSRIPTQTSRSKHYFE